MRGSKRLEIPDDPSPEEVSQASDGISGRKDGKPHGWPMPVRKLTPEMKQLRQDGLSYQEIAERLGVGHASVNRWLLLDP